MPELTARREPLTLFLSRGGPRDVVADLRELVDGVEVEGPEDDWRALTARIAGGLFRAPLELSVANDPDFYAEPGWSQQRSGMRGYLARFPDTPHKAACLAGIDGLTFALAVTTPDIEPSPSDARWTVLVAVTAKRQGVIFAPSTLYDAHGRVLMSASGAFDADAVPLAEGAAPGDGLR